MEQVRVQSWEWVSDDRWDRGSTQIRAVRWSRSVISTRLMRLVADELPDGDLILH